MKGQNSEKKFSIQYNSELISYNSARTKVQIVRTKSHNFLAETSFHSYLLFLYNYLWNWLADFGWILFQSKSYRTYFSLIQFLNIKEFLWIKMTWKNFTKRSKCKGKRWSVLLSWTRLVVHSGEAAHLGAFPKETRMFLIVKAIWNHRWLLQRLWALNVSELLSREGGLQKAFNLPNVSEDQKQIDELSNTWFGTGPFSRLFLSQDFLNEMCFPLGSLRVQRFTCDLCHPDLAFFFSPPVSPKTPWDASPLVLGLLFLFTSSLNLSLV